MIVVPAPLEQKVAVQKTQLISLSAYYARFQIDIADNIFVPNKTTQIDELFQSSFFNMISGAVFDFHLMVSEPEKHIKLIKQIPKMRVGIILIHKSVFPNYSLLTSHYPLLKFGLVLDPKDEVAAIDSRLLKMFAAIQVMTVIPGFQGQPFIEEMLTKIEQLRKRGYSGEIMIDGSVNEKTLPMILSKKFKPDVLGIGSYLTKAPPKELKKRVAFLQSQLNSLSRE